MLVPAVSDKHKKGLSPFYAFAMVVGGNLGVGNIAGTAMAVATSGPGAVVWMCIICVVASVVKYSCCVLGIKHRKQRNDGTFAGGPMHYIESFMKNKFLACVFSFSIVCGAITVGNFIQINSLTLPMQYLDLPPIYVGIAVALIILFVVMGNLKTFVRLMSSVVPFMAIIYILSCLIIMYFESDKLLSALKLIFYSSLGTSSISGGFIAFSLIETLKIVQTGVSRAIIAADIGLGLESIIHSEVKQLSSSKNSFSLAVEQGLVSVISPFVVMFISLMTTIVLVITGVWDKGMKSSQMCFEAFRLGFSSDFAGYLLMLILFCFAFTTILTWLFCADKAVEFLTSRPSIKKLWHALFITIIPLGSLMSIDSVWGIADVTISVILVINMLSLFIMYGSVLHETKSSHFF